MQHVTHQPRKRTFVPGAQSFRSRSITSFEATGPNITPQVYLRAHEKARRVVGVQSGAIKSSGTA